MKLVLRVYACAENRRELLGEIHVGGIARVARGPRLLVLPAFSPGSSTTHAWNVMQNA
jgi:hypothetical protein